MFDCIPNTLFQTIQLWFYFFFHLTIDILEKLKGSFAQSVLWFLLDFEIQTYNSLEWSCPGRVGQISVTV